MEAQAKPELKPREAAFVAEYLKNGGNGTAAVLAAGINPNPGTAKFTARDLMKKESVQGALAQAASEFFDEGKLSLRAEIERIEKMIDLCIFGPKPQMSAAAKFEELRQKLKGNLFDRVHLTVESDVDIMAALEEGKRRARLPPRYPENAIDAELVSEVPLAADGLPDPLA